MTLTGTGQSVKVLTENLDNLPLRLDMAEVTNWSPSNRRKG
jgi:hypothetical protein